MEDVTTLCARKGGASRMHHPKVMKVRQSTTSSFKTLDRKAYFLVLEKRVPSKFRKELLQEDSLESV